MTKKKSYPKSGVLTPDFKLVVLLGFEQRVREAVPGQLLADLRQKVVCEQAHRPQQSVEDIAEERLRKHRRVILATVCWF